MIYVIWLLLGFLFGGVIRQTPSKVKGIRIWPFYSAFGIAVLFSVMHWFNMSSYAQITGAFVAAFPGIALGAQEPKRDLLTQLKIVQQEIEKLNNIKILKIIGVTR